ncbi:MAG: D-glycero-beta-D-manno-heptose-7-phosphate kinase [Proteobacteria bacterium]|nr:D-glycero-beta-D-manno-heptose-7-phosphate kinase [Pseudomonadota bacterium]
MRDLIKIIDNFKGKKIGILGDLILDKYIFGDVERISPEAPIPVVLVSEEFHTPGGAGNVANNIGALGGKVFIAGLLGEDDAGKQLLEDLVKRGIDISGVIKSKHKHTSQKMRIVARGQHIVRVDKENNEYIENHIEEKIISYIEANISSWDGLVISDYAKGLVTKKLAKKIIELSNMHNKFVIGDTKPVHATFFKNSYLLTPNYKEAIAISGLADVAKAGKKIQRLLNCNVLITQGAQGMLLFEKDKIQHFPTIAQEIFDVAGAGDTVAAAMAISLASGSNLEQATIIANHAAGIVVGKIGTATVSIKELKKDLIENGL